MLWLRKFHRPQSITLLAIFGVIFLVAGDVTARIVGVVMISWAVLLVVLWRKHIFFLFSSRDRSS